MLTRWDEWYSEENLAKDARLQAAPPSRCAAQAAQAFHKRGKHFILDLACGIGRDTRYLDGQGFTVVGAEASPNGLRAARQSGITSALVVADARRLPFCPGAFGGVHCFGLLHEFTGEHKAQEVAEVMGEIERVLEAGGILALATVSGEPEAGLPHVQCFSQEMFAQATHDFETIEIKQYDDIGCTGRTDYHVWYSLCEKETGL